MPYMSIKKLVSIQNKIVRIKKSLDELYDELEKYF